MKLTMKLLVLFFVVLMLANTANAESPREQLRQMIKQLQKSPTDNALREKIIKLAQQLKPAPAVPEEARRYLARGIAAFENAKSTEDFKLAVPEFQKAANAAPWWPDSYFNLAKVQEKVGDFKSAIASYGLYLIADPNAKDAEIIRTQSYKLEFMAEQKGKEDEAKTKEAQRKQQAQSVLNLLKQRVEGATYSRMDCHTGYIGISDGKTYSSSSEALALDANKDGLNYIGCNRAEYQGSNWFNWKGYIEHFDFSEEGAVRLVSSGFPEPHSIDLVGTPNGPSISDIKWACPKFKVPGDGSFIGNVPAWAFLREDGSAITYTCDSTSPESNPAAKYAYWYFKRN